jgi:hypothetical protein
MRKIILHTISQVSLLLFVLFSAHGQPIEKTLVKSFNLEGKTAVALEVPGPVEVQTWSHNYLRVQMQITLDNGNEAIFKSLVQAGRYNLRLELNEERGIIRAPAMAREVQIGGQPLGEQISLLIFAPDNVLIELPQQTKEGATATSSL